MKVMDCCKLIFAFDFPTSSMSDDFPPFIILYFSAWAPALYFYIHPINADSWYIFAWKLKYHVCSSRLLYASGSTYPYVFPCLLIRITSFGHVTKHFDQRFLAWYVNDGFEIVRIFTLQDVCIPLFILLVFLLHSEQTVRWWILAWNENDGFEIAHIFMLQGVRIPLFILLVLLTQTIAVYWFFELNWQKLFEIV